MMNVSTSDQTPNPPLKIHRSKDDPFGSSLLGEQLRLMMLATASCAAVFWAAQLGSGQPAMMLVISCIVALGAMISNRFAGSVRLMVLAVVLVGLVTSISDREDWIGSLPFFSPLVVAGILILLFFRDVLIAARHRFGRLSYRTIGIGIALLGAASYMILLPTVSSILDRYAEKPASYVVEDLTTAEILRIRSSKLVVFAIFAYLGACAGSFLNVAAASAPRGEPIGIRTSCCPKCNTPIRRIDNFPIISYLMLQGRCRHCEVPIPFRYLAVELIATTIFASLFLYELVTGAANVPGFRTYHYAGIVWIILYTKWPVIGIYFYHAIMFCCVLMFALMEIDRQRCPRWMALAIIGTFAGLMIIAPTVQPVAFDDQLLLGVSQQLPDWATQAITCAVGGLTGWLLAWGSTFVRSATPPTLSLVLLGVTLGWQATLTITLLWLFASAVIRYGWTKSKPNWLEPTGVLFAVAMLHHPAWEYLTLLW